MKLEMNWLLASVIAILASTSVGNLALAQQSERQESDKIIAALLEALVSQPDFDAESVGELAKSGQVAKALVNLFAKTAMEVDESNAECFDATQGFKSVHVAMEPFGKLNTARYHTDRAKRKITNVVVENKAHQNLMENVQNWLGKYHPSPISTDKYSGLEFSFTKASASSAGPVPIKTAPFVCQIKPSKQKPARF